MDDLANLSDDELLRRAVRGARRNPVTADFELGQIYGGLVIGNETLEKVWQEETAPEQAELDLHLGGPNVPAHVTNARLFARFVAGISKTVKETAKAKAGRKSYSERLLVEGATPGSVRVVFRAPNPAPRYSVDNNPAEGTEASTVDSDALRRVATVFALSSDNDPESPLYSELRDLPDPARAALKRIANLTIHAGWEIEGHVRQRHFGADSVTFGPAAAVRLRFELESIPEQVVIETLSGRLDGFRRSLGTVYIIPDIGRAIPVVVQTPELLRTVSALAADPDIRVVATMEVVRATSPDNEKMIRISRTLLEIGRAPDLGTQLEID